MRNIKLSRIDENNFIQAFNLKLDKAQEQFVSHPIRSLAQAYVYYNQCTPFGIFDDDTMIGYVMVIYDYDLAEYNIWHMMIDESDQGQGYGGIALDLVIEYIKTKPFGTSDKVTLTCNMDNIQKMICEKRFTKVNQCFETCYQLDHEHFETNYQLFYINICGK